MKRLTILIAVLGLAAGNPAHGDFFGLSGGEILPNGRWIMFTVNCSGLTPGDVPAAAIGRIVNGAVEARWDVPMGAANASGISTGQVRVASPNTGEMYECDLIPISGYRLNLVTYPVAFLPVSYTEHTFSMSVTWVGTPTVFPIARVFDFRRIMPLPPVRAVAPVVPMPPPNMMPQPLIPPAAPIPPPNMMPMNP